MSDPTNNLLPASPIKRKRNPLIAAHVEMIDGRFDLSADTIASMNKIRKAAADNAREVEKAFYEAGHYDEKSAIDAIRLIQAQKNMACDALILPFCPVELLHKECNF